MWGWGYKAMMIIEAFFPINTGPPGLPLTPFNIRSFWPSLNRGEILGDLTSVF